jgi:hypothetical protein
MSAFHGNFRACLLAGAAGIFSASGALAAGSDFNIPPDSGSTAKTVGAGNTGTIAAGNTLSAAITWSLTTNSLSVATINNSGTINAGAARGIDTSGALAGTAQSFTLNNLTATSLLTSTSDAFRVNGDIGAGTVTVDNFGSIKATNASSGRALSFNAGITNAASTVNITNETTGLISAAGDDAIRPGTGHVTITNSGMIQSTATSGRAINLNLNTTATTDLSSLKSFTLTNNNGGTIQSNGDAMRITASVLSTNAATNYVVNVDNAGTIKSTGTGANNGQAIDFNDLVSPFGKVTITNEATGIIQAADADALRPGNVSTVNNYGAITALNGTLTSTGNDGIDFQDSNAGTVNNFSTGSITGARHGITGKMALTIANDGSITGQAGSGINLDTTAGTTTITNSATGTITGNIPGGAVGQDGDGIDVDYLVNLTNSGKIIAAGTGSGTDVDGSPVLNEALAIGGGTVTNNQGGLIQSDQRAITVDNSSGGNAFGAVTIDNAGTITGKDGEAIRITSNVGNTLLNRAIGIINGSVVMGGGDDTINLYAGSTLSGALDGGGGNDTIHLTGTGNGSLSGVSNVETLKVDQGNWSLSGGQSYANGTTIANGATASVSGALDGGVVNNGTLKVNGTTASFDSTVQNNGAIISDPASVEFLNLSIGANGYIQASAGDLYKIDGNFLNASTQNALWDTSLATLEFAGADGTSHVLQLTGTDIGKAFDPSGNFGWDELVLDSGNSLNLEDGLGLGGRALYLESLLGAAISGDGTTITNIFGDGFDVYYDPYAAGNGYLKGLDYLLAGGGRLISDAPEPGTWSLFIAGFGLLGGWLRRRGKPLSRPV